MDCRYRESRSFQCGLAPLGGQDSQNSVVHRNLDLLKPAVIRHLEIDSRTREAKPSGSIRSCAASKRSRRRYCRNGQQYAPKIFEVRAEMHLREANVGLTP